MKKRLFPLLLLLVFLAGVAGHLLLRPEKEETRPYTLTFSMENVNNILLYSMPKEGDTLFLMGSKATLLSLSHTPRVLHERSSGETVTRHSRLYSAVTLTLAISASEQNGRLSVGGKALFLGDTVTLLGKNLSLPARFTQFRPDF